MAKKAVVCGNFSGRKIDKYKVFGFIQATASFVKAPLIDECYINIECKVVDGQMIFALLPFGFMCGVSVVLLKINRL
jgi:flavin reductase (DIM6/NTAB) family NADH-FMN oxidoreductase RutF